MKSIFDKGMEVYKMVVSKEGALFANAFSYSLLVGLAPLIIIAIIFIGNFVFSVDQMVNILVQYIPKELVFPFIDYITLNNDNSLFFMISLFSASAWVASKTLYSFLMISSDLDRVKIRSMYLRVMSVVYFVLLVLAIVGVGLVLGFVPLPSIIIVPITLLVFFFMFYSMLSFRHVSLKALLLGSIFSSVAMGLLGRLFFDIINRFTNHDTIYGPLSSLMILLISLKVISTIIFTGYAITYVFKDHNQELKNAIVRKWLVDND